MSNVNWFVLICVFVLLLPLKYSYFEREEKNRKQQQQQQQQRLSSVIFHSISFINLKGNLILQFEAISFHYILFWEGQSNIFFTRKRFWRKKKKSKIPRTLNESFAITFLNAGTKNGKKRNFCFSSLKQAKINSRFFVAVNNVSFPSIDISFLS